MTYVDSEVPNREVFLPVVRWRGKMKIDQKSGIEPFSDARSQLSVHLSRETNDRVIPARRRWKVAAKGNIAVEACATRVSTLFARMKGITMQNQQQLLLTPREAARTLAISERTLWAWSSPRGTLPVVRVPGSRAVRYSSAAIASWIESLQASNNRDNR